jgi:hypothetical protein
MKWAPITYENYCISDIHNIVLYWSQTGTILVRTLFRYTYNMCPDECTNDMRVLVNIMQSK